MQRRLNGHLHHSDVTMSAIASQITGVSIVYSTVCSGADQRKNATGHWTYLVCKFSTMADDDLATQGARASATMNSVPPHWRHYDIYNTSIRFLLQYNLPYVIKITYCINYHQFIILASLPLWIHRMFCLTSVVYNILCLFHCHSLWRHQMETFSALLAFCIGNSPVTGEFPAQRPVTRSFDVFFDLHLE